MASCEGNSSNVPCLATSQTASIPAQAAVVNRQPLSFSISRILGLEENESQHGNTSNEGMPVKRLLSEQRNAIEFSISTGDKFHLSTPFENRRYIIARNMFFSFTVTE